MIASLDPIKYPKAFETVTKTMMHNPCGILNKNVRCMENGRCTKEFPKDFSEFTFENADGYPVYRRRDDGKTFQVKIYNFGNSDSQNSGNYFKVVNLDNRWIVPYNLYLTTKYNCHINVEIWAKFIY